MHRCYICEGPMDEIKIDLRDLKPRPCSDCEAVIKESLDEFDTDEGDIHFVYLPSDETSFDIVPVRSLIYDD